MPASCKHSTPQPWCHVCHPELTPRKGAAPKMTVRVVEKRLQLPVCEHRGPEVLGAKRAELGLSHSKKWYGCGKGLGTRGKDGKTYVCPCQGCGPSCSKYEAGEEVELRESGQTPRPPVGRAVPDNLPVVSNMVAIGHYGLPGVIELQAKMIRKHNGPNVPILVSDDHSEQAFSVDPADGRRKKDRLLRVCADYGLIYRDTDFERRGHAGGDLGAYHHGLIYAKRHGIRTVMKLSQRFLIDIPNWLHTTSGFLIAKNLPTMSRPCYYGRRRVFHMRTEAVLMNVDFWGKPEVIRELKPRTWNNGKFMMAAENLIWSLVNKQVGNRMLGSPIFGEDRTVHYPGVYWKDAGTMEDRMERYQALAKKYDVDLGPEFHVSIGQAFPGHRH
jgi:hypothetical protein